MRLCAEFFFVKTAECEIVFYIKNKHGDIHSHADLITELLRPQDLPFFSPVKFVDVVGMRLDDDARLGYKISFYAVVKPQFEYRFFNRICTKNKGYAESMIAKSYFL